MATKKTKVVVNSNGKNIDHTMAAASQGQAPLKLKVLKGAKYLLQGDDGLAPENVTLTRVGADLHITLEGEAGPSLVLEGYYTQLNPVGLYGVAEDGQLYAYARTDTTGDIYALADGRSAPVVLSGQSFGSGAPYLAAGAEAGGKDFLAGKDFLGGMLPLMLSGGVAAIAAGAMAAEGNGIEGAQAPVGTAPPDVQPPAKPGFERIGGVYDNVGTVTGQIKAGGTTDDTRPDFSGTGTPGHTIALYDHGTFVGKVVVNRQGTWALTPSRDLGPGKHAITITESDAAGRESEPSDPFEFAIDTTVPPTPGSASVADKVGTVIAGGVTDDARPDFTGQGTPGNTVVIRDKGIEIGKVEVDSDGHWHFTPPGNLGEGGHAITLVERDAIGNESRPSDPFAFSVDTIPPEQPKVGGAVDGEGSITGTIAPGGFTDERQPELHGRGAPGNVIVIRDNGIEIGTADVGEDGTWHFIPPSALSEEKHTITLVERDVAGNESKPSAPFEFTVDVTPPDASKLSFTGVEDAVGAVKGSVASGGMTDDARPVLSGTSSGEAGHTVTVTVEDSTGTHVLGVAVVGENGHWTLQVEAPLAVGLNQFTVIERDAAGNQTAPTAPYSVTVDMGRPVAPTIQNVMDDVDTVHMLQKGEVTDDAKPTITGTAPTGSTVKVYDNGTQIGEADADESGNWRFTPETALADGTHDITATATHAGQTSEPTGIWNFVLDTTPPVGVTDFEVMDHVGGKQEALAPGETTDDDRPTFSGKAEPGATVNLYDNGAKIGHAVADKDGQWRFTPDTALASGDHAFTTEVIDKAGNSSGQSEPMAVVVDAVPGVVTIGTLLDDQGAVKGAISAGGSTDDTRPEIQGTGKAGSTIRVYDGETLLGQTDVQADGTWRFTPTEELAEGAHTLTATATDLVGNLSAATPAVNFIIDTIAPTAPTLGAVADDVGAVQGALTHGDTTDDSTPTLSGTAEAGSSVVIKDNGIALGKVTADAEGHWSYTPTTPLAGGEHTLTITATDAAGNTSAPSAEFSLALDYASSGASASQALDLCAISDGLSESRLDIEALAMDGKAMHIDLSMLGMKAQSIDAFDPGSGGGVAHPVYTNLAGTAELLVEDKVHVTML